MYELKKIEIHDEYPLSWRGPLDKKALTKGLGIMAKMLGRRFPGMARTISLYLVDDKIIAKANEIYMQCSGPTNILSFPGQEDFSGILLLSVKTYNRECRLYGQAQGEHLLRLLAHGLSHVAGLDHGEEMDDIVEELHIAAYQSLFLM